jgi:hypothetical protein
MCLLQKKRQFSFPMVNFPFLDGDVPLAPSYGNNVTVWKPKKLLYQGYCFNKLLKTWQKLLRFASIQYYLH